MIEETKKRKSHGTKSVMLLEDFWVSPDPPSDMGSMKVTETMAADMEFSEFIVNYVI
jgi:hypothetical protein